MMVENIPDGCDAIFAARQDCEERKNRSAPLFISTFQVQVIEHTLMAIEHLEFLPRRGPRACV